MRWNETPAIYARYAMDASSIICAQLRNAMVILTRLARADQGIIRLGWRLEMKNYDGKVERQIEKLLDKRPFFADEIRCSSILDTIRNMKLKYKDILCYSNHPIRKNLKNIPLFRIVYRSNQREEAWKMVNKRFPQIRKIHTIWTSVGIPILDGLVRHGKDGKRGLWRQ